MAVLPTHPVAPTSDEFSAVEAAVREALRRRSVDDLNILGFGELTLAIGWPSAEPTAVFKRIGVHRDHKITERQVDQVGDYLRRLDAAGVPVLPTVSHLVDRGDGSWVGYVAQPLVPKELLAETTIARDDPEPEHPIVVALRRFMLDHATPQLSADMQITNFAWDGERLVLLDVTTPLVFAADGSWKFREIARTADLLPAVLRPPAVKLMTDTVSRYRNPDEAAALVLGFFHRIGQERWVPAVAESFRDVLTEPVDLEAVAADHQKLSKAIPFLKRSCLTQRWWSEKVRRRPYEYFITNSYSGTIL